MDRRKDIMDALANVQELLGSIGDPVVVPSKQEVFADCLALLRRLDERIEASCESDFAKTIKPGDRWLVEVVTEMIASGGKILMKERIMMCLCANFITHCGADAFNGFLGTVCELQKLYQDDFNNRGGYKKEG